MATSMFSTKGRYALRAMVDLATHDGWVSLGDVSERQNISRKYLEQVIALMHRAGYVESLRGKGGGYRLTRAPEDYTLGEILRLPAVHQRRDLPAGLRLPHGQGLGRPRPRDLGVSRQQDPCGHPAHWRRQLRQCRRDARRSRCRQRRIQRRCGQPRRVKSRPRRATIQSWHELYYGPYYKLYYGPALRYVSAVRCVRHYESCCVSAALQVVLPMPIFSRYASPSMHHRCNKLSRVRTSSGRHTTSNTRWRFAANRCRQASKVRSSSSPRTSVKL